MMLLPLSQTDMISRVVRALGITQGTADFPHPIQDQAASLGVGRLRRFWHVTLPQVRSGAIATCIFSFIGVWSAYLVVAAVAPPTFETMSLIMFPMIATAAGGYAVTACGAILYIAPILAVLVVFSKLTANDETRLDARA